MGNNEILAELARQGWRAELCSVPVPVTTISSMLVVTSVSAAGMTAVAQTAAGAALPMRVAAQTISVAALTTRANANIIERSPMHSLCTCRKRAITNSECDTSITKPSANA